MRTATTYHLDSTRHIGRVYTSDALDSFETQIRLQDAIEELHICTNRLLDILNSTRDDGSTREVYLRLAAKFYNAYEVVEDEENTGVFIPPEIRCSFQPSSFDQMLEKFRFQDEQKLGVYHVKQGFVPKDCFASPTALGFGCWVAGLTIDRKPPTHPNKEVIEFWNSRATERHLRLDQHQSPGQKFPECGIESMLNRFIDLPSEDSSSPFFATRKDVSLSANRRYFGLLDISVAYPLAGNLLDGTLARIPGIHGSRLDISSGFGTPTCLHTTPAALYSVSALLSGSSRIWIVISADQRLKFESLLREKFPEFDIDSSCLGCPAHKMIFLLPSFLNSHQIKYSYFEQRVGDIVITTPGCYIQSYNTGSNVVETSLYADKYWHPPSYAMCSISTNVSPSDLAQLRAGQAFECAVWPDTRLRELLAIPITKIPTQSVPVGGHKADNPCNNFESLVYTPSPVSTFRASNAPRGPLIDFDIYEAPPYLIQVEPSASSDSQYLEIFLDSPNNFTESYGSDSSVDNLSSSPTTRNSSRLSTPDDKPFSDDLATDSPLNDQGSPLLTPLVQDEKNTARFKEADHEAAYPDSRSPPGLAAKFPIMSSGDLSTASKVASVPVSISPLQRHIDSNTTGVAPSHPNPQVVLKEIDDPYLAVIITRIIMSIGTKSSIWLWISHMNATFWNPAKPARFSSCLSPREELCLPLEECETTIEESLRTLASLDGIPNKSNYPFPYSNYLLLCRRWAIQVDSMASKKPRRKTQHVLEKFMMAHLGYEESDRNSRRWDSWYGQLTMWYYCGIRIRRISEATSPVVAFLFSANTDISIPKHEICEFPLQSIGLLATLLQRYRGEWIEMLHQAYKVWFERVQANQGAWKAIDLSKLHTYSECDSRILELFQ